MTNSLKPSKPKLLNIKISFFGCKSRKLHQYIPFLSIRSVFKQILSARFRNHIVETDKTIYKVGRKNTNEVFLTSSSADSAKKCTTVLFEIPPSMITTKYLWYLLHIYNMFITYLSYLLLTVLSTHVYQHVSNIWWQYSL